MKLFPMFVPFIRKFKLSPLNPVSEIGQRNLWLARKLQHTYENLQNVTGCVVFLLNPACSITLMFVYMVNHFIKLLVLKFPK